MMYMLTVRQMVVFEQQLVISKQVCVVVSFSIWSSRDDRSRSNRRQMEVHLVGSICASMIDGKTRDAITDTLYLAELKATIVNT